MNSCKKKLKNQTMALKQQLKNVLLLTWDSPDCYLCNTYFKMAIFLQFIILIKLNIGYFYCRDFIFRCNSILYARCVMSACIYRSDHGSVEPLHCSCNILYSRCQALDFLLLVHLRTGLLSTVSLCFKNTRLTLPV